MHAEIHQLTKWKYLVDVYNDQGDRELARTCKTLREALAFAKAYTTEIKYFRVGVFERYIC